MSHVSWWRVKPCLHLNCDRSLSRLRLRLRLRPPTEVGVDRTNEARATGGGIVSKAVEESAGTITIYTDVASPYNDAQEVSRSEAVIGCEAVRASRGASLLMLDASDKPFLVINGSNFPNCAVK